MSDEMKLAPCPFCGNTNPFLEGAPGARPVTCNNDYCQASIMPEASDEKAIAAWNRRSHPSRDAVIEEVAIALDEKVAGELAIAKKLRGLSSATSRVRAAHAFQSAAGIVRALKSPADQEKSDG